MTVNIQKETDRARDYLSFEELEERILDLSDVDIQRLTLAASRYTGGHELDSDDLVQEAICRVLEGSRKTCPVGLPVVEFLIGVMRSMASEARKPKKPRNLELHLEDEEWANIEEDDVSPEYNMIERQAYEGLERLFEGDDEALLLLFHLAEGGKPSEICTEEGWAKTKYDTIRKRVRRRWNTYTAKGNKL